MLGDNSLWISHTSAHFASRGTNESFVFNYLFQDVCIENNLAKQRQCLPPEQRAGWFTVQYNKINASLQRKSQTGLLTAHYKRLGSLTKLSVPQFDANPLHVQHPPRFFYVTPVALGWQGEPTQI